MSTSAADAGHIAPPPRRLVVDRRLMGVAIVTEIVAVALAYMAIYVPVLGPKLTRDEVNRHWVAAVVSAIVVVCFGYYIVRTTLRARRILGPSTEGVRVRSDERLPRIPHALRFERVPGRWQRIAAAISLATLPVTIGLGDGRLWLIWLALLAPWAPLVVMEARFKFSVNAVFASFGLMVILQSLHMVEHSTQVVQLAVTGGALADSHGVIGQLDFETVHFFADTALWISLGLLAVILRGRNVWLWVAFVAASLHEIEHLYLFWLYVVEHTVYLSGGAAGIMGQYGLIGSPLDRPYLHYTYNFIVSVPLLLAFWDQARYVDRTRSQPSA
ncbi:MAG TPA: hypothetical protein VNT54_10920 [Solirubrobacteraceae bacterium]|nr:hypothetical protein [Solirubrobacteraceae bacterium]